jgi:hypothetical protein
MSITLTQLGGRLPATFLPPGALPSLPVASVSIDVFGAKGNGATDDSTAFRLAAATGRWVELGPKTYRIDANVLGEITGRVLLRGVPGRSTILCGALPASDWQRITAPDVHIDGVTFDANASLSGGGNIWPVGLFGQTGQVRIRRCRFIGAQWGYGRGLIISADTALPATLSIELDDVEVSGAATDGLWIEHAANMVARRLNCWGNGDAGLRIQRFDGRAGAMPQDILISASQFHDNAGAGVSAGIYEQAGNTGAVFGPDRPEVTGLAIEDSQAGGNGGYGFHLAGDRLRASRLRAWSNGSAEPQGGITMQARHGVVEDCQVHDQLGIAIDVGGSREVDVSGNEVWDSGNAYTIGAARVTGSNNRAWGCTGALISVFSPESSDGAAAFPVRVEQVILRDTTLDISDCVPDRAIQIADGAAVLLDGLAVLSTSGSRTAANVIGARSGACRVVGGTFNGSPVVTLAPDGNGVLTVPDLASVVEVAGTAAITAIRTQSQADVTGGIAWATVTTPGSGYSSAEISVSGDGSGAVLAPLLWDGTLYGARVTNSGTGYTSATASITGGDGTAELALQIGMGLPDGLRLTIRRPAGGVVFGRLLAAGDTVELITVDGAWTVAQVDDGRLTATKVLWVTGAAGNDATTDGTTFATAFRTIQAAVDAARMRYRANGQTVLIQVYPSGGPYTDGVTVRGGLVGDGTLQINGNGGVAAITAAGNAVTADLGASVLVSNLAVSSATGKGLYATNGSLLQIGAGVSFGATPAGSQIEAAYGARVLTLNDYTITAGGVSHFHANTGGLIQVVGRTITLTGTPAYSEYFCGVGIHGAIYAADASFSGAATGTRYVIHYNGVVRGNLTDAAAEALFPGDAAGVLDQGGVFDNLANNLSVITDASAARANLGVREPLTTTKVLWVTGSVGSDATTDGTTFATGFKTIQAAVDAAYRRYSADGQTVLIQVYPAGGPYANPVAVRGALVGGGVLQINGNGGAAAIAAAGNAITADAGTDLIISNLTIASTAGKGVYASNGALIQIGPGVTFGAAGTNQIEVGYGGRVIALNGYSISGGAVAHVQAGTGGLYAAPAAAITLTGTPAFASAFVVASMGGAAVWTGASFTGAATGVRYLAQLGGAIKTGAADAAASESFFPGSLAGNRSGGGYLDLLGLITSTLRVSAPSVPASASAAGDKGQIAYDASYLYVWVAANAWKRSALSSW